MAQQHRRLSTRSAAAAFILLLPILMGGCPEFQNSSIQAVETAARGILDAALTLFFDQYRSDAAP
ncbi:MAG: hypothetical protein HY763_04190 [Planctomycetes bacterium]|nr:hypothetical protein [Planctomycetota bacterium]